MQRKISRVQHLKEQIRSALPANSPTVNRYPRAELMELKTIAQQLGCAADVTWVEEEIIYAATRPLARVFEAFSDAMPLAQRYNKTTEVVETSRNAADRLFKLRLQDVHEIRWPHEHRVGDGEVAYAKQYLDACRQFSVNDRSAQELHQLLRVIRAGERAAESPEMTDAFVQVAREVQLVARQLSSPELADGVKTAVANLALNVDRSFGAIRWTKFEHNLDVMDQLANEIWPRVEVYLIDLKQNYPGHYVWLLSNAKIKLEYSLEVHGLLGDIRGSTMVEHNLGGPLGNSPAEQERAELALRQAVMTAIAREKDRISTAKKIGLSIGKATRGFIGETIEERELYLTFPRYVTGTTEGLPAAAW